MSKLIKITIEKEGMEEPIIFLTTSVKINENHGMMTKSLRGPNGKTFLSIISCNDPVEEQRIVDLIQDNLQINN